MYVTGMGYNESYNTTRDDWDRCEEFGTNLFLSEFLLLYPVLRFEILKKETELELIDQK